MMRLTRPFSFALVLATLTVTSLQTSRAEGTPKHKVDNKGVTAAATKPTDPATQSKSSDNLATSALKAASSQDNNADYVPCKFTYGQLQSLAIPERKNTFSPADAEQFVQSVVMETLGQQTSGLLDETTAQAIVGALDGAAFVGLTPSQSLAIVMRTLAVVRNTARVQNDFNQAEGAAQAQEDGGKSKSTIAGLLRDASFAMSQAEADIHLLPKSKLIAAIVEAARSRVQDLVELAKPDDKALVELKSAGDSPSYAGITKMQIQRFATTASNESIVTGNADNVTVAAGMIVGKAKSSIDSLMRPKDVGCAMSVLSADETRRAYGRLVGNRYIAVQIVVRNLNEEQAFILHDAELAVNVDPGGLVGRFYSGRDKVIVRQVSNAQQFFDARNIIVHTIEGIGAVMSSASLVFGGALADATNVYQSGFYQSFTKAWRDMSVDQLNLLNDTGFSSQTNAQVVVPKTGSVMFVMFIPSKQFEEAWWALPCATRNVFGAYADLQHRELIALTANDKVAGNQEIAATGYDIQHALESCKRKPGVKKHWTYNPASTLKEHASGTSTIRSEKLKDSPDEALSEPIPTASTSISAELTLPGETGASNLNETWMFDPVRTPYSKWSGNSLAIFQELSTAVVAGMHIANESTLAAQLTEMICPHDTTTGNLTFPSPDKGQLQCTLTGKNLDKVNSVRLRNSKDPADAATVDGEVKISGGDNTTGSVTFQTAALHKLSYADYTAMLVDKNGLETKTNAAIHLDLSRDVEATNPTALDASNLPALFVLTGYHLAPDGVKSLILKTSSSKVELPKAGAPVSTDTTLNFDGQKVTAAQWAALGSVDAPLAPTLVMTDGSTLQLPATTYKAPPK